MFRDILSSSGAGSTKSTPVTRSSTVTVPENARSLQQIAPEEKVQIITETVPSTLLPLLQAMGLCNNCDLRVCQSNGTCILAVEGSRIGLSDQLAASIQAVPVCS